MKKHLLILSLSCITIILVSCNSFERTNNIDPRDKSELAFIEKIQTLATRVRSGKNDLEIDERLDSCKKAVSTYVVDSLKGKFNGWTAEILEINNEPFGFNVVETKLMIRPNMFDDSDEYPEYSSIILKCYTNKANKAVIDMIRKKHLRDTVKINGVFEQEKKKLEFDGYSSTSLTKSDVISNPEFSVKLSSIL